MAIITNSVNVHIKRRLYAGHNNVEEWYVKDAGGNTMATYKKDAAINNGELSATEFYKYGSSLLSIKNHIVNVEKPVVPKMVLVSL